MVIYKFENKINGKVYIGQTVQKLSKRISSHKYPGGNKNLPIDAAIKKYGIENFSITTIDHANSVDELNEKEKFWIKHYDCISPKGYNLEEGGRNSRKPKSQKIKVAIANKGRFLGEKSPRSKRVYKFSLDGRLLDIYGSAREAARENGISSSQIASSCRGEHYLCKGYIWSYSEEPNLDIPKKSGHLICFQGKTMTLKDWSEHIGIPYGTLCARIYSGWSVEKALTTQIDNSKRNVSHSNKRE